MSDVQDPARIQADDSLPSCSARLTRSYQLLAFTSADLRLLPPTALFPESAQSADIGRTLPSLMRFSMTVCAMPFGTASYCLKIIVKLPRPWVTVRMALE